jgi:hypothetical protein
MPKNMIQRPWGLVGTNMNATAGAADAALGVAERTYKIASALTNTVVLYPIPLFCDFLEFRFRGKTNGDNHVMDVWMGRLCGADDTSIYRVATLDVEIGLQQSLAPTETNYTLLADEITLSNEALWDTTGAVVQSLNDSDLCARLVLPTQGQDLILFHGHTTFANNLKVEYTGFS